MNQVSLKNKGWRRHSIISSRNSSIEQFQDALPQKILQLLEIKDSIAIIITYDCAVIDENFEREPWLQLLIAFPSKYEKRLSSCRDPRRLHISIIDGPKELNYEVNATGFCQVNREILSEIDPDINYELPQKSKSDVNYWVAERFRQETWPDEFNKALQPIGDRLKRFFKRYNLFSSALYLQLNTDKELYDEKYQISVIFAIEHGLYRALLEQLRKNNKQLVNKEVDEVIKYLESEILDIFNGVVIFEEDETSSTKKAIAVLPENAITLRHLKTHFRFSPYSLSSQDITAPVPLDTIPGKVFGE